MPQRVYIYDPEDKPVVGGYAATVPEYARRTHRQQAIEASGRVTTSEYYQPTGDIAFDLRVSAFREILKAGRPEAFEESHDAFLAMGLHWQGTFGDPLKSEKYKDPPTNVYDNYNPPLWDVATDQTYQDWMFRDFCYAAWLWVRTTDPYKARKWYIDIADKLLKEIPGKHMTEMDKWPKWSAKASPPVMGGLYLNEKWKGPSDWTLPAEIPGYVKLSVVYKPPPPRAKAIEDKPEKAEEKTDDVSKPEVPKIDAAEKPAIEAAEASEAPKAPIPTTEGAIKSDKKVAPAIPLAMKEELAQRRKQILGSPSSAGTGTPNNAVPEGGPPSAVDIMAQRLRTQHDDRTPDSKPGSGWDSPANAVPPPVVPVAVPVAALPDVVPEPPVDVSHPVPVPEPPAALAPPPAPLPLEPSVPSAPLVEGPIPEAVPIAEVAPLLSNGPIEQPKVEPVGDAIVETIAKSVVSAHAPSVAELTESSEESFSLGDLYKEVEEAHKDDPPQPPFLGIGDVVKHGAMMAGAGLGLGALAGLGVAALKQTKLWPFFGATLQAGKELLPFGKKKDKEKEKKRNKVANQRRNHPRAWNLDV